MTAPTLVSPAVLELHATARRLLALGGGPPGRPPSMAAYERIAERTGLQLHRAKFSLDYHGEYVSDERVSPPTRIAVINIAHSRAAQRAQLAEALMQDALDLLDHDSNRELIHEGTLHLLAPGLPWPTPEQPDIRGMLPARSAGAMGVVLNTDFTPSSIDPELLDWFGLTWAQVDGHWLGHLVQVQNWAGEPAHQPPVSARTRSVLAGLTPYVTDVFRITRPLDGAVWLVIARGVRADGGGLRLWLLPVAELGEVSLDIGHLVRRVHRSLPPASVAAAYMLIRLGHHVPMTSILSHAINAISAGHVILS